MRLLLSSDRPRAVGAHLLSASRTFGTPQRGQDAIDLGWESVPRRSTDMPPQIDWAPATIRRFASQSRFVRSLTSKWRVKGFHAPAERHAPTNPVMPSPAPRRLDMAALRVQTSDAALAPRAPPPSTPVRHAAPHNVDDAIRSRA